MHIQGLAYSVHDEELCLHILGQGCHGAFPGRNVSLPCLSLLLSFYLTLSSHQYCRPLPFPSIICPLRHHPLHCSPLCCCPVHNRLLCCPSTIAIVPSVDSCTIHQPLRLRPSSRCPSTIPPYINPVLSINHRAVIYQATC